MGVSGMSKVLYGIEPEDGESWTSAVTLPIPSSSDWHISDLHPTEVEGDNVYFSKEKMMELLEHVKQLERNVEYLMADAEVSETTMATPRSRLMSARLDAAEEVLKSHMLNPEERIKTPTEVLTERVKKTTRKSVKKRIKLMGGDF
jgi:hypothetical protein